MASSSDGIHWNKLNKDLIGNRVEEDEAQASPDLFYATLQSINYVNAIGGTSLYKSSLFC
jgi:hypothetical protein